MAHGAAPAAARLMHAVISPRSRLLAALAVATVIIYVAASPFYLWGSMTLGDMWMLLAVAALLTSDRAANRVVAMLLGSYGAVALLLTVILVLTALHALDAARSTVFIVQLTFCLWLVIPIVAAGVAELRDPVRTLGFVTMTYLAYYAVGLVLLFGFGNDVLLYQTPIGRVFPRFATQGLQLTLMALAMAGLVFAQRGRLRYLALLLLSLVPLLLGVNRTGLVSLLLVAVIAAAGALWSRRGVTTVLVGMTAAVALGYAFVTSSLVRDVWQIRILTLADLLEDQARVAAMSASLADLGQSGATLLLGNGWGSGAGADIVVHNFLIQVTHDSGLLALLPFSALLLLPAVWVARERTGTPMERHIVLMLTATFLLFWSLNALVVERSYWLTYALALGLAHRVRAADADRMITVPFAAVRA